MKSKEFLTEWDDMNLKDIARLIKRDCQPYLNSNPSPVVNYPLWRGILTNIDKPIDEKGSFRIAYPRLQDRKPRDTPPEIHNIINHYFKKYYGHPYRNSVFASGSKKMSGDYGDEFIIFPIGKFEFIWHPDIPDLWNIIQEVIDYKPTHPVPITKEMVQKAFNYLERVTYRKNGYIAEAIESGNEIMIWVDSYYALSERTYNYNTREALEELL